MNILFVSHKWQAKTGESCAKALTELGHNVRLVWAKIGNGSMIGNYYNFLKRNQQIGPFCSNLELHILNQKIRNAVLNVKPDLIIVNAGGEVSPETLKYLRRTTRAKLVCWAGDDPSIYCYGPYYKATIKYYDHVFLVDPTWYTRDLKNLGLQECSILQYGVDPSIYHPLTLSGKEQEKYGTDLTHVGAPHPGRIQILPQLLDYDLTIYGATSSGFFKNFSKLPKELLPKVKKGIVPATTTNKIYNGARICLNIQHPQVSSAHSNKTFEIAASGSFCLTSFNDKDAKCYTADEMVSFRDVKELRYLIDHFLNNPAERDAIAKKAYAKTMAHHLYTHRFQLMLDMCKM